MRKLMLLLALAAICGGCEGPGQEKQKEKEWEAAEFEVLRASNYYGNTNNGWPESSQPPALCVVRSAEQIPDFIEFEANDPVLSVDFSTHSLLFVLDTFGTTFHDINTGFFVNIHNDKEHSLDVTIEIEAGLIIFPTLCPWIVIVKTPALSDEDTVALDYKVNTVKG